MPSPGALEPSLDQMRSLVVQAQNGNTQCVPQIKALLNQCPRIWQDLYSLSKRVEESWISAIAGKDLFQRESLSRQVQALRISLADTSTDPIENLLIDVICSTYLSYQHAQLAAAASPSALCQAQENHVTQTQKRYISALKELGRMRQLLTPRPPTVLHIAR